MHVVYYSLGIGLLVSNPIPESASPPEYIDLSSAIEIVSSKHPDLLEPRAAILAAEATIDRARAGRLPRGEARVIFGIVNGAQQIDPPDDLPQELAPLFAEGGANDPLFRLGPFTRATFQLIQPLFTFGKISQGIKAANAGLQARHANLAIKQQDLRIEIHKIYYGYQLSSELHRSFQKLEDAFDKAHKQAGEQLRSGESAITQTDILKLQVALLSLSKRVLQFDRQKQTALLAFRRVLGFDIDAKIFPDSDRLKPVEPVVLPSENYLLTELTFQQPVWKATQTGLIARTAATQAAARAIYPDVFIGLHADLAWAPTRDDVQNPYLRDEFNRIRGGPFIGLRWPLDISTRLAQKNGVKAQQLIQAAKVEQARTGLPLKVKKILLEYKEKKAALRISQKARKAGRSLSFITSANFGLGIGDAKEILESLGIYARSLGEYYQTVFEYNIARFKLSEIIELDAQPKPLPSLSPESAAQKQSSHVSEAP